MGSAKQANGKPSGSVVETTPGEFTCDGKMAEEYFMNHRDSKLKDMLSGCHQLPLSWILYQTPESKEYRDLQRQYKYGRIDEYTWPDYENFHSAWMAAEELYAKKDKHEVVTEKEESKVWQALAEELNVKVGKMFLEEFTKLVSKNYDSDTCHQKAWDEIRRSFT